MMTITHPNLIAKTLVSLLLGSALLTGCSEDAAIGPDTATTAQTADVETTFERAEVVLSVPGMTCPMCPITVRKALAGVDGVLEAHASLDDKQAHVVFDPARTEVDALIAAVNESGFTAAPHGEVHE